MPKYLVEFSYNADGVKGLLKEGGTSRRDATKRLVESLGGTMEAYYFTFGEQDGFIIADMPDTASAAAASLIASGSGAVSAKTKVIITPEEMDAAGRLNGDYRAPGR